MYDTSEFSLNDYVVGHLSLFSFKSWGLPPWTTDCIRFIVAMNGELYNVEYIRPEVTSK